MNSGEGATAQPYNTLLPQVTLNSHMETICSVILAQSSTDQGAGVARNFSGLQLTGGSLYPRQEQPRPGGLSQIKDSMLGKAEVLTQGRCATDTTFRSRLVSQNQEFTARLISIKCYDILKIQVNRYLRVE